MRRRQRATRWFVSLTAAWLAASAAVITQPPPVVRAATPPVYHAIALGLTSDLETLWYANASGIAAATLTGNRIARVDGQTVTPLTATSTMFAVPTGIDASGTMVGYRWTGSESVEGLRFDGTTVTPLAGLGRPFEIPNDIDDAGTLIVGTSYSYSDNIGRAWVRDSSGTFTELAGLGGDSTVAQRVTNSGLIGGTARTSDGATHFVTWQGGVMRDLGQPGTSYANFGEMNEAGQFVGNFGIEGVGSHAVVFDGSTFIDLGTFGGSQSSASDIDEGGRVVGSAQDATGTNRAYLWEPGGVIQDLGDLGGTYSEAASINELGQITGTATTADGTQHGYLIDAGVMYDLNDLVPDDTIEITQAGPITESGHILAGTTGGSSVLLVPGPRPVAAYQVIDVTASLSPVNDAFPRDMNASRQATGSVNFAAFRFDGTTATRLFTSGESSGEAINAAGDVVGYTQVGGNNQAFLYDGSMHLLGTLGAPGSSAASDVNAAGDVVGWASSPTGQHAFLYRDGAMHDLATPGAPMTYARAINDAGTIIGYGSTGGINYRGYVSDGSHTTDIGDLGGPFTTPYAINEAGEVVGTSSTPSVQNVAFRYADGVLSNIAPAGSILSEGIAINAAGVIAGSFQDGAGIRRAFLWDDGQITIVPDMGGSFATSTDINAAGKVVGYAVTAAGKIRGYLFGGGQLVDLTTQLPLGYDASIAYVSTINDDGSIIARAETSAHRDRVLILVPATPDPVTPGLTIDTSRPAAASVGRYGRFEKEFTLDRSYSPAEVNDPSVIDVTATFTAPGGGSTTVPAFFGTDYTVQSGTGVNSSEAYLAVPGTESGVWHARFSPDQTGTWHYTLRARDRRTGLESTVVSPVLSFTVTASTAKGQVQRDPRDDRFLRYADGTPYLPMGHNVAFQQGEPVGNDGEHYVEPLFASMEAAGQDWTRIWMTDFNRNALEWSSGHWAGWYTGVGRYAGQSAFRIERQLDVADAHGLQVQLVLNDHGQVRSMVDGRWDQNPYNAANGGPVAADHPEAFFTDPAAKSLFKQRLRYLVARYGAYRNVLAWELFNEVQFVGSDTANPYTSAQVRADIVAWHAEMAAYLRTIDPYDHLITTSSDIESSLKDIWADPNIDLVQVHDYEPALTTRDTRFRGYVDSLNAAYEKPVIIGEFGIAGNPEIEFDPVAAAPLDDREAHLLQGTHLHNAAWAAAMSGSGAMTWWWGAYVHSSPAHHRQPPDFPLNERLNPPLRDFFAGEDLAGMALETSVITAPASVVALGLDDGAAGFVWIRDTQNEYGSGVGPGDVANRTIAGVTLGFAGYGDGTYRIQVHDPWGVLPMDDSRVAVAVGGTLTVPLPTFTRDIALKIHRIDAATPDEPVLVDVTSPNGGPVIITETTPPGAPPVGSGFTFVGSQYAITAPAADTTSPIVLEFIIDQTVLQGTDPDLTAATVQVFRNGVPLPDCTASTSDDPATPDPCVVLRETLTGTDAGDARVVVFTSQASTWNIGAGPAQTTPGQPTAVTAVAGDARATVTWTAPADDGNSAITSYLVTSSPGGLTASVDGVTTTATVLGLTNGTSYTFTVRATNGVGPGAASAPSNAVTPVAKLAQTITFGNLGNRTMLQTPFTVTATASSGLPVAFSTTTPTVCTSGGTNGATITLVGAGTCTVQADQAGNATYRAATSVVRTFTVSRVTQTITFGSLANRTMLQSPFTVSATASSGLAVSFASSTPAVCTTSGSNGSTVTLVGPGSCNIVASQAGNATYAPAPDRPRAFTVSQVSQTVTFASIPGKTMLQSPLTVTATASSGLPVSFTTTTPAVCTAGGTNGGTITFVVPGSCSVVASQPGNGVYAAASSITRTFAITKASQTITFTNPGAKTLVQSPLTVSGTASSGLPVTFTTTTPAVCTASGTNGTTITLLTTGSCSVVASQAGTTLYAPAPSITRSFTVTKASQTITFPQPPTAHLAQSPVTMAATASSGLAVTFTSGSTNVCTAGGANGATITLLRTGNCKIVAHQAGNAVYSAAGNVTRTFTVTSTPLAQSITFGPLGSRSIGDAPMPLGATASSGLPVSYAVASASSAICSVAGGVVTLERPGACTITASQPGNAVYLAATPVTQTLTATLAGFVQASGTSLVLDGQPFRIFGAAIYQTSNNGHTADPEQIFDWAEAAGLNTVRLTDIFLQTTNDPGAPYAEADWVWIDSLIEMAGDRGMKVILDLSSYRNWLVWSAKIDHGWVTACEPNQDRSPVDYPTMDPYTVAHRADWTQFMDFVANRVNTKTGIVYRKDPTILVVSIAGEAIGPGYGECGRATTTQELTDFFAWALAEWKSHDPFHLRSTGGLMGAYGGLDENGDPIPSGQQLDGIAIFSLADNTLPSLHTYPPQATSLPLADGQTPVLAPVAHDLGKPWFTEEFGFRQEEGDAFRASEFDWIYDRQIEYGSCGSLFWNLGPEVGTGTFDVNPSTPLVWARVLAEAP